VVLTRKEYQEDMYEVHAWPMGYAKVGYDRVPVVVSASDERGKK
jgi:hypothetical protein